jgi:hypothetical protein
VRVIVVVGTPAWIESDPPRPGGRAGLVALAAAAAGARVELVGKVGDDAAGDALILALATAGVGHVAVLRDAAHPTHVVAAVPHEDPASDTILEATLPPALPGDTDSLLDPADVALGLRYLNAFNVLVVSDDVLPIVHPVAVEAAGFAGAQLVVLVAGGSDPASLPPDATVLEVPAGDADGSFAGVVGRYAVALDAGSAPSEAFASAMGGAPAGA